MSATLDQYQQDAIRTCSPLSIARQSLTSDRLFHLLHSSFGLVSDLDELLHNTDPTNAVAEAGDVFWFLNIGYYALNSCIPVSVVDGPDRHVPSDYIGNMQADGLLRSAQHEAANFADAIKAAIFYGKTKFKLKPSPDVEVTDQTLEACATFYLDRVLAYLCLYSRIALHLPPRDVMAANIAKLKSRYGDKFSQEAALTRNEDAEHAAVFVAFSKDVEGGIAGSLIPPQEKQDDGLTRKLKPDWDTPLRLDDELRPGLTVRQELLNMGVKEHLLTSAIVEGVQGGGRLQAGGMPALAEAVNTIGELLEPMPVEQARALPARLTVDAGEAPNRLDVNDWLSKFEDTLVDNVNVIRISTTTAKALTKWSGDGDQIPISGEFRFGGVLWIVEDRQDTAVHLA